MVSHSSYADLNKNQSKASENPAERLKNALLANPTPALFGELCVALADKTGDFKQNYLDVLSKHGYGDITDEDLCAVWGVNSSTIFGSQDPPPAAHTQLIDLGMYGGVYTIGADNAKYKKKRMLIDPTRRVISWLGEECTPETSMDADGVTWVSWEQGEEKYKINFYTDRVPDKMLFVTKFKGQINGTDDFSGTFTKTDVLYFPNLDGSGAGEQQHGNDDKYVDEDFPSFRRVPNILRKGAPGGGPGTGRSVVTVVGVGLTVVAVFSLGVAVYRWVRGGDHGQGTTQALADNHQDLSTNQEVLQEQVAEVAQNNMNQVLEQPDRPGEHVNNWSGATNDITDAAGKAVEEKSENLSEKQLDDYNENTKDKEEYKEVADAVTEAKVEAAKTYAGQAAAPEVLLRLQMFTDMGFTTSEYNDRLVEQVTSEVSSEISRKLKQALFDFYKTKEGFEFKLLYIYTTVVKTLQFEYESLDGFLKTATEQQEAMVQRRTEIVNKIMDKDTPPDEKKKLVQDLKILDGDLRRKGLEIQEIGERMEKKKTDIDMFEQDKKTKEKNIGYDRRRVGEIAKTILL